ncbi:MAG: F0F1 ATP synthase subunit B [Gemmatimonadota bacterium]|nr:F0F1 ATP synthase subunit B [Gemmatimonadota bacterium]
MHRSILRSLALVALTPALLLAQEHEATTRPFMKPDTGLMFWTLLIFVVLIFVLSRYAFGPLTRAVEAREKSLQEAIDAAKRDRDAAAALLAQQQAQLDASRAEAQKYIVDGRTVAEKMRADLLEQTRVEQQQILERARAEIQSERDRAILELRHEAVDLAIKGASKVIEKNLDDSSNRALVENFLSSLDTNAKSETRGHA